MTEPDGKNGFSYDVAFSFAGEDREYVERVAKAVEGKVRLFYDRHEQTDLWGKNLYTHLAEVYGQKSRFCVMFISKHYARKLWTNHERESAQACAFSEHQTYVLPARFDDTAIPGVLPTVGYVDLRSLSPEEFARLLLEKVASPGTGERPRLVAQPVPERAMTRQQEKGLSADEQRRREHGWVVGTRRLALALVGAALAGTGVVIAHDWLSRSQSAVPAATRPLPSTVAFQPVATLTYASRTDSNGASETPPSTARNPADRIAVTATPHSSVQTALTTSITHATRRKQTTRLDSGQDGASERRPAEPTPPTPKQHTAADSNQNDTGDSRLTEAAPPPKYFGVLKFEDTGEPVTNAEVQLVGTACATQTDKYGNFAFDGCDPERVRRLINPVIRVRTGRATAWCNEIPLVRPPDITAIRLPTNCRGNVFPWQYMGSITPQGTSLQGTRLVRLQMSGARIDGSTLDLHGSGNRLNGLLDDGRQAEVIITGGHWDPADHGGDAMLYSAIMRPLDASEWTYVCEGKSASDRAAVVVGGFWDAAGAHVDDPNFFTLACSSGVISKCIALGYGPRRVTQGASSVTLLQACTRMARADYCGNGVSHTKSGTLIAVFGQKADLVQLPYYGMTFEATWTENGASCIARTRWHDLDLSLPRVATLNDECERRLRTIQDGLDSWSHQLPPCAKERKSALIWNASFPWN